MTIKRKLFFAERLLDLDGDRSLDPISITYMFSIKGNIPLERIRIVLDKLQKQHPAFRARIEGKYIFYEDPGVVPPIPLKIIERVSDETWKKEKEPFTLERYDYEKGPLFRVLWIRSNELSEFIFTGLHVILDWKSCVLLANEFLTLINEPDRELKPYLPISSLKELLTDVSLTWKEKLMGNVWAEIMRWKLIIATWNKKMPPRPQNYRLFLNLDNENSLALKKITEKKKVSLGSISCLLAAKLFKARFHPQNPNCIIYMSLDIRRFVSTVKKNMVFGFAPMIYPRIQVWDDKELWEQAGDFDKMLADKVLVKQKTHSKSIFHSLTRGLVFAEYYYNRVVKLMVKRNIRVNEGFDFIFLNLGKQFPLLKNPEFSVQTAYTPELRMPWFNSNIFGVGEFFDDTIGFGFFANEHHIPEKTMRKIRSDFEQAIFELIKKDPDVNDQS